VPLYLFLFILIVIVVNLFHSVSVSSCSIYLFKLLCEYIAFVLFLVHFVIFAVIFAFESVDPKTKIYIFTFPNSDKSIKVKRTCAVIHLEYYLHNSLNAGTGL